MNVFLASCWCRLGLVCLCEKLLYFFFMFSFVHNESESQMRVQLQQLDEQFRDRTIFQVLKKLFNKINFDFMEMAVFILENG